MNQKECIQKLIILVNQNPDLKIIAKVQNECVPSDDYAWYEARIGNSEVEEYWQPDEQMFIGEEYILDEIEYRLDSNLELPDDYDEVPKMIDSFYDDLKEKGEIKKAIFVEIRP